MNKYIGLVLLFAVAAQADVVWPKETVPTYEKTSITSNLRHLVMGKINETVPIINNLNVDLQKTSGDLLSQSALSLGNSVNYALQYIKSQVVIYSCSKIDVGVCTAGKLNSIRCFPENILPKIREMLAKIVAIGTEYNRKAIETIQILIHDVAALEVQEAKCTSECQPECLRKVRLAAEFQQNRILKKADAILKAACITTTRTKSKMIIVNSEVNAANSQIVRLTNNIVSCITQLKPIVYKSKLELPPPPAPKPEYPVAKAPVLPIDKKEEY